MVSSPFATGHVRYVEREGMTCRASMLSRSIILIRPLELYVAACCLLRRVERTNYTRRFSPDAVYLKLFRHHTAPFGLE